MEKVPDYVKDVFNELIPYLKRLIPESTACRLIEFDEVRWEELKIEHPSINSATKRVLAEAEAEMLEQMMAPGCRHWQTLAWRLERLRPDVYSRPSGAAKGGKPGRPSSGLAAALRHGTK